MEQNRDRGKIKWTSLMLPEHLERLREWQREDDYIERPDLADFELQAMQETLEAAFGRRCETWIDTWHDGKVRCHQGEIETLDTQAMTIVLRDPFGIERIRVADIIDVRLSGSA